MLLWSWKKVENLRPVSSPPQGGETLPTVRPFWKRIAILSGKAIKPPSCGLFQGLPQGWIIDQGQDMLHLLEDEFARPAGFGAVGQGIDAAVVEPGDPQLEGAFANAAVAHDMVRSSRR